MVHPPPLKSNSDLKKHIDEVKDWFKDGKGNLVVLRIMRKNKKTRKRLTLLYLTNYNDDNPVDILKH